MELQSGALLSTKEIGVRASRWPSPSIVARHDMKVGHLFARCLAACALKQPPYLSGGTGTLEKGLACSLAQR